jgi:Tfp pilus assembly protein PilE
MTVVEIIVLIMVVTILATITLAVLSYGVFRMREKRRPRPATLDIAPEGPRFFERVSLPQPSPVEADA